MVSSLRSKFKHDTPATNPGIVLSPRIATVYPAGTSVKLIVRPKASAEDAANLPSVKFTCDVMSTAGHVLWKVLMDLEEKGLPTEKDQSYIFAISGETIFSRSHSAQNGSGKFRCVIWQLRKLVHI